LPTDQQTTTPGTPTAKRTSSVSITVDGASPSKRRKMNSNENCAMIDDSDVIMSKFNFFHLIKNTSHFFQQISNR
jgi:hypothetical protein